MLRVCRSFLTRARVTRSLVRGFSSNPENITTQNFLDKEEQEQLRWHGNRPEVMEEFRQRAGLKNWKPLSETWDNKSLLEGVDQPTGFASLEEMLEYGRKKKLAREKAQAAGEPSPFRVSDTFTIPKHEIVAAVQEADKQVLYQPNTHKVIQEMTGIIGPETSPKEEAANARDDFEEMTRLRKLGMRLAKLLPIEVEIESRMYNKTIPGGIRNSYAYMFVAGNGKGYAGWGYGKSPTSENVREKANMDLLKNLMFVPLWQGRTVFNDSLYAKFQGTKIYLWRRPTGHGVHAAPIVNLILRAFGITDVTVKIHGSRTRASVVKCMFKLLAQVVSPTDHFHGRGKAIYDPDNRLYRPLTYKEMKEQQLRVKEVISEIPRKYGVRMSNVYKHHPMPTPEEFEHYERMEEVQAEIQEEERKKFVEMKRRQGFELTEEDKARWDVS